MSITVREIIWPREEDSVGFIIVVVVKNLSYFQIFCNLFLEG